MLWHQSLKCIHYRTLFIFQNKKNRFEVKTWEDKRHVLTPPPPPLPKYGGDTSPPSPQDLRPWYIICRNFVHIKQLCGVN